MGLAKESVVMPNFATPLMEMDLSSAQAPGRSHSLAMRSAGAGRRATAASAEELVVDVFAVDQLNPVT